ncbi:MAG: 1-acyl-sn-glycerol-3-phosphate acyltransferase [Candidatus Kerfeldbacteria bacterium]|nr:1-acyl-sn-glycerol-3-phosphate acyltransferase [Candidatus Kerfeldbacteria bacterium]
MAYPIARWSFLPFVRLFTKHIEGTEHIPTDQPVVLTANHLGLFDPLFIGAVYVSQTKKKLRFLVNTRNFFWKTIGITLQHWTNTIPKHANRRDEAIDRAVKAVQAGDSIGLFPEGQVNTSPTLLAGRSGAVRISLRSQAPLLPVGIANTDVPLATVIGRRFANRQEGITIRFGQPYQPVGDPDDPATVQSLTDGLMHRIAMLSRKVYAY